MKTEWTKPETSWSYQNSKTDALKLLLKFNSKNSGNNNKLLIKLQKSQEVDHRIVQRQSKVKHKNTPPPQKKKDIYL